MNRLGLVLYVVFSCLGCGAREPWPSQGPSAPSIVPFENPSSETVSPAPASPQPPQPVPRAIVTGGYEVTLSAQNCSPSDRPLLPRELRTRTLSMRVEQTGAEIWVLKKAFADSSLNAVDDLALWGEIDGDGNVQLTNYYGNDQWNTLWDQASPDRAVLILVERMLVAISADGSLTVGKFAGYVESVLDKTVIESGCASASHSVTFVRRGPSQ